jgi:hypothetical protein
MVVSPKVRAIKQDCAAASMQSGSGPARHLTRRKKSPCYFNELYRQVNEKISMLNGAPREQHCLKTTESSMDLLSVQGMSRDTVNAVRYRGRSWTAL